MALNLRIDAGTVCALTYERLCAPEHRHKLKLLLDFAGLKEADVPEPCYGGQEGSGQVLNMVEAASRGLDHVRVHLLRVST